jgi:glycosyltransferase 2 family protein
MLVALVISVCRWWLLLQPLQSGLSLSEALRLGFQGMILSQFTFGSVGGDLYRAVAVGRGRPGRRLELMASVLIDRGIGLVGLLSVATAGPWLMRLLAGQPVVSGQLPLVSGLAATGAVIGILGLVVLVAIGGGLPQTVARRVAQSRLAPVLPWLERLDAAARLFRGEWRLVAAAWGISVCSFALLSPSAYLISASMYAQLPTLAEHLLVIPVGLGAGTLPLTPGGVGVQEMALGGLFNELGEPPAGFSGLLVGIAFRLLQYLLLGVFALKYFLIEPLTETFKR